MVFGIEDGEVADTENDFVKQFFVSQPAAVPDQVAGDVPELQGHPLLPKGVLPPKQKQRGVRFDIEQTERGKSPRVFRDKNKVGWVSFDMKPSERGQS